jgi:hypothetical protein
MPEGSSTFNTHNSARARIAANISWAFCEDRAERTAPARTAFLDRFEKQVDPEGLLHPSERHRRAEALKKAYFTQLALKSAAARQSARSTTKKAR